MKAGCSFLLLMLPQGYSTVAFFHHLYFLVSDHLGNTESFWGWGAPTKSCLPKRKLFFPPPSHPMLEEEQADGKGPQGVRRVPPQLRLCCGRCVDSGTSVSLSGLCLPHRTWKAYFWPPSEGSRRAEEGQCKAQAIGWQYFTGTEESQPRLPKRRARLSQIPPPCQIQTLPDVSECQKLRIK